MSGNAGLGRPKGSRNRFTADLLARMTEGRTPVDFALCIMHTKRRPSNSGSRPPNSHYLMSTRVRRPSANRWNSSFPRSTLSKA